MAFLYFWESSKMALFGQIRVIFRLKSEIYIACGFLELLYKECNDVQCVKSLYISISIIFGFTYF